MATKHNVENKNSPETGVLGKGHPENSQAILGVRSLLASETQAVPATAPEPEDRASLPGPATLRSLRLCLAVEFDFPDESALPHRTQNSQLHLNFRFKNDF